jgi:predicted DNA-binding transcriptional regulator AlpA
MPAPKIKRLFPVHRTGVSDAPRNAPRQFEFQHPPPHGADKPASAAILRPAAAANYLGLSLSTLAKMRVRGDGPRFIKLGQRCVGYMKDDLDRWLNERRRRSTSDNGPSA